MTEGTHVGDSVGPRQWINAGAGIPGSRGYPALLADWQEIRVDIDPSTNPDILANITDLSEIPSGAVSAVWSSHCLEHLYQHEVSQALAEFHRVLSDDGFIVAIVPDLQVVAELISADKFHETLYTAAIGPVTPHDMFYGYGPAIAQGFTSMAHRCGFTPAILVKLMRGTGFAEFAIKRRPTLELAVVARKTDNDQSRTCEILLQALGL